MSLKIDIEGLPSSVSSYTMEQLAKVFAAICKDTQILILQIKESHLPQEISKIYTWNFWSDYGNVPGITDVKRSIVKMMLYARMHKNFNPSAVKETADKAKNVELLKRVQLDLQALRDELKTCPSTNTDDIVKKIIVKEKMIEKLNSTDSVDRSIEPAQIAAVAKRVFEILKTGDGKPEGRILLKEFEYIEMGGKPKVDKHRFKEGGRTIVYKTDAKDSEWKKDRMPKGDEIPKTYDTSAQPAAQPVYDRPMNSRPMVVQSQSQSQSQSKFIPQSQSQSKFIPQALKKSNPDDQTVAAKRYVPPYLRNKTDGDNGEQRDQQNYRNRFDQRDQRDNRYHRDNGGNWERQNNRDHKGGYRVNGDNRDGLQPKQDGYVSLTDIKTSVDTSDMSEFPDLVGQTDKPVRPVTIVEPKILIIDPSNIFSTLVDLEWDADPDVEHEHRHEHRHEHEQHHAKPIRSDAKSTQRSWFDVVTQENANDDRGDSDSETDTDSQSMDTDDIRTDELPESDQNTIKKFQHMQDIINRNRPKTYRPVPFGVVPVTPVMPVTVTVKPVMPVMPVMPVNVSRITIHEHTEHGEHGDSMYVQSITVHNLHDLGEWDD